MVPGESIKYVEESKNVDLLMCFSFEYSVVDEKHLRVLSADLAKSLLCIVYYICT